MSTPIGSVTLIANTPGIFNGAPPMGARGVIVSNESPFTVAVVMQGTAIAKTLLPETVDFFPIVRGFNGNITYNPTLVLTNPSSYTAATLSFDVVGLNENINVSAFPMALTRPAVSSTATGKPIFSATIGFGATATNDQQLNVFNPPGSGVTYTFHSARVFTNDSTTPTANLIVKSGADLNLSTAVAAQSHAGTPNPPVSTAHCTGQDAAVSLGGDIIEVIDMQASVTQDFLNFPDSMTLAPGDNLLLYLASGSSGHIVRLTLKWSEDIYIPPVGGVMGTIVTEVINQNNPAPSPVVQASPAGDSGVATLLNNNGQLTLGDAAYHGLISILTGGQGDAKVNGTSGTATLYQPWRGDVKLVVIELSGFANAGTGPAINLAIPVPFTKGAMIITGDNNNTSMLSGGNAQSMTVYPWGGTFQASNTNIGQWANGECNHPIDTIQWPNSQATLRNGRIILLGT